MIRGDDHGYGHTLREPREPRSDRAISAHQVVEVLPRTWPEDVAHSVCARDRERDQVRHGVRAHPELIPDAVEESIRYHTWIPTGRLVVKDIEFHGVQMKVGDWVQAVLYGGSNDSKDVAHPEEFQGEREPNRHLGFGAGVEQSGYAGTWGDAGAAHGVEFQRLLGADGRAAVFGFLGHDALDFLASAGPLRRVRVFDLPD